MNQDEMREFVMAVVSERLEDVMNDKSAFPKDMTEAEVKEKLLQTVEESLIEAGVPCRKTVLKKDRVELHFDGYILNFGLSTRRN